MDLVQHLLQYTYIEKLESERFNCPLAANFRFWTRTMAIYECCSFKQNDKIIAWFLTGQGNCQELGFESLGLSCWLQNI